MSIIVGRVSGSARDTRCGEAEGGEQALVASENAIFCEMRFRVGAAVASQALVESRSAAKSVYAVDESFRIFGGNQEAAIGPLYLAGSFAARADGGDDGTAGSHVGEKFGRNDGVFDSGLLVEKEGVGGGVHLRKRFRRLKGKQANVRKAQTGNFVLEGGAVLSFTDEKPEKAGFAAGAMSGADEIAEILLLTHVSRVKSEKRSGRDVMNRAKKRVA